VERLTNNHHHLWEQADYRTKAEKQLRGLLVANKVLITRHVELHANLLPPPKPKQPLIHNILNYLMDKPCRGQFDAALFTMDFLQQVGRPDTLELAEHLEEQVMHLMGNSYEPV